MGTAPVGPPVKFLKIQNDGRSPKGVLTPSLKTTGLKHALAVESALCLWAGHGVLICENLPQGKEDVQTIRLAGCTRYRGA